VTATDPDSGHHIETVSLKAPSGPSWATWRTVKIEIELGAGANMVTLAHTATDQGSTNVDRLTLA
jgi:hypothetical protein